VVDVSERAWRRAARVEVDERQVRSCAVPAAPPSGGNAWFTPSALELEEWLTVPLAVVRDDEPAPPVRARTLVRATVVAVLLTLLGGGTTALALDKTVKVTVDGERRTMHTFSSDVAGVLESAGIIAAPQDRVEPAPTTPLSDGDHVVVERARPLTLVEGGSERLVWTTAGSLDEALRDMGVEAAPAQMSTSPDAAIPLSGLAVELTVPRMVSLTDGTEESVQLTTTAGTVAGLLAERGVALDSDDVAVPTPDTVLTDGMAVQVVRNGVDEVVEVRRIEPPEQVIEDPVLPRGRRVVVERGAPGEQAVLMRVFTENGVEVRREQVRASTTIPPRPRIVRVGTSDDVDTAPAISDGSVWDRLAKCESRGNWSINTGNGYYGGLQFNRATWMAYDGDQYAPLPHQASRDEQIAVGVRVRDDRGGYGAWPSCARKLGLPR
jgi:uncharacterized protein YabE (DUF348 family)